MCIGGAATGVGGWGGPETENLPLGSHMHEKHFGVVAGLKFAIFFELCVPNGAVFQRAQRHTPAHWAPHAIRGHVVDEGNSMELVPARENPDADIWPALYKRTFLRTIADGRDESLVKLLHGDGAARVLVLAQQCHRAELHGDVERG